MKIATYNLRYGGRGREHWRRIRDEVTPDILLLQETADPAEFFAADPGVGCVWRAVVSGEKRLTWGSAVVIRGAMRENFTTLGFEGWIIGAEMDAPAAMRDRRPLRVFSLHAPTRSGTSYIDLVNKALDAMRSYAEGAQLIVGGDFNLTISKTCASEDRQPTAKEDAIQERLRDELGLVNCWRSANPGVPLAQTLRWSRDPSIAHHIDGLFVPAAWLRHLRGCHVVSGGDWTDLSDHNPIVAEFDFE